MLDSRGVGPFPSSPATRFRPSQPDEHGAAGRVAHVADQPIATLATAVGEVVTAYRFGLSRETVRQFGGIARHHAASRSPIRSTG
jgi:hypothetical protein